MPWVLISDSAIALIGGDYLPMVNLAVRYGHEVVYKFLKMQTEVSLSNTQKKIPIACLLHLHPNSFNQLE